MGSEISSLFRLGPARLERTVREIRRRLQRAWFRVSVEGLQQVPRTVPLLVVANRSGLLAYDAALVAQALAAHRDPLAGPVVFEDSASRVTAHRALFPELDFQVGGPVEALEELRRGRAVLVFPEGRAGARKTVWQSGTLASFGRGGFVRVALQAGAPILPVRVDGGQRAFPVLADLPRIAQWLHRPDLLITPLSPWLGPLGRVPLPGRWSLRFGSPLRMAEAGGSEASDDCFVEQALERVRSRLQTMLVGDSGGNSSA